MCCGATASPRRLFASTVTASGPSGEPTIVQQILADEVDMIVNTPWGVGPRVDGYEIRTAAVLRGVPCMTTVQGLAACVQGIEALLRGDIGVRSLQEHAAILHADRAGTAERDMVIPGRPTAPAVRSEETATCLFR